MLALLWRHLAAQVSAESPAALLRPQPRVSVLLRNTPVSGPEWSACCSPLSPGAVQGREAPLAVGARGGSGAGRSPCPGGALQLPRRPLGVPRRCPAPLGPALPSPARQVGMREEEEEAAPQPPRPGPQRGSAASSSSSSRNALLPLSAPARGTGRGSSAWHRAWAGRRRPEGAREEPAGHRRWATSRAERRSTSKVCASGPAGMAFCSRGLSPAPAEPAQGWCHSECWWLPACWGHCCCLPWKCALLPFRTWDHSTVLGELFWKESFGTERLQGRDPVRWQIFLHSLHDAAKKLQSRCSDVHRTCQDLQLGCVSLHHCSWPEAWNFPGLRI